MKYFLSKKKITNSALKKLPLNFKLEIIDEYYLIYEKGISIIRFSDYIAIIDGYILDHSVDKNDKNLQACNFLSYLASKWPMASNFSGSFSITLINIREKNISICNDPIGPYPLYYKKNSSSNITISNSLLCFGWFLELEKDETGLYQRLVGPELSNIGSRTIFKNVKRVLPGEKIIFQNHRTQHLFDNTLFSEIGSPSLRNLPNLSQKFNSLLKNEIGAILDNEKKANLALSGGLDSRILLANIPQNTNLTCLTYGAKNYYENKIAKRLAKRANAAFKSFDDTDYIFPKLKILYKYVLKTESVLIPNWLAILEKVEINSSNKEFLFIGDMCEALNGRNIGKFNTKNAKKKNFINANIKKREFKFTKTNSETIKIWQKQITDKFLFLSYTFSYH